MEIKIELLKLGKRQVDLVPELKKRGITTNPPELSNALRGLPRPKFEQIREESMKIIEEWQKERD